MKKPNRWLIVGLMISLIFNFILLNKISIKQKTETSKAAEVTEVTVPPDPVVELAVVHQISTNTEQQKYEVIVENMTEYELKNVEVKIEENTYDDISKNGRLIKRVETFPRKIGMALTVELTDKEEKIIDNNKLKIWVEGYYKEVSPETHFISYGILID